MLAAIAKLAFRAAVAPVTVAARPMASTWSTSQSRLRQPCRRLRLGLKLGLRSTSAVRSHRPLCTATTTLAPGYRSARPRTFRPHFAASPLQLHPSAPRTFTPPPPSPSANASAISASFLAALSTMSSSAASSSSSAAAAKRHAQHKKQKVAIIGSGNWGSAIARIAGINTERHASIFEKDVMMYVYEEEINGRKLTQIINEEHENPKYLPGIKLPAHVRAVPSAAEAAQGATLLVFVLPHQFIGSVCQQLKGKVDPSARAISMIKGVDVRDGDIRIFADVIEATLGVDCSALSGANIANEVAQDKFSETTIGHREGTRGRESAELFFHLFDTPTFKVGMIEDVAGVSLCGALKNVVAIAAGFTDGLGWGDNAKAAVMRIGLMEMKRFSEEFFKGVKPETFTETSAGIADLITTCMGGRNRKCAEAFVKTGKPFDQLERELLNGQKLQGTETAREVHEFLKARGKVDEYPLFRAVYSIAYEGFDVQDLTSKL
ncbi:glycerol-3-phosphate dehydrogenase [Thecaphora frezii]